MTWFDPLAHQTMADDLGRCEAIDTCQPEPSNDARRGAQNRIRALREKQCLTQADLAARVGTSQSQIDRIEKSKRKLTVPWMERIARALGVHPTELVDWSAIKTFPGKLAAARASLGLGQDDLAERLGASQSAVSRWEAGIDRVPPERCIALEAALGGRLTRYDIRPDIFGPASGAAA